MAKKRQPTITNRMLLEHMQAGHEALRMELTRETGSLRKELTREIRRLDSKIEKMQGDVSALKGDVAGIKTALQRLYERRIDMVTQLENHEKRIVRLERAPAHAA